MKKYLIPIIGLLTIVIVLCTSVFRFDNRDSSVSYDKDITVDVDIDGEMLKVFYSKGNLVDEKLAYGNKYQKIITIENNTDKDLSYALAFNDVQLSDDKLTYTLSYSYDADVREQVFLDIVKNIGIRGSDNLAYNLVVAKKSKMSLCVTFMGNNEDAETMIKGVFEVKSNLSEKDIFRRDVLNIHSSLLGKINSLNGINEKGIFIVNINSMDSNVVKDFKGFILINANDYSDPLFYYYVSNEKFMLYNYNLKNSDFEKKYIKDIDVNLVNNLSFNGVCLDHSKRACGDFSNISYNALGGKNNFYKNSSVVINSVKDIANNLGNSVYVIDVKSDISNNTNVRGYVLINKSNGSPEYFLYLTNDIYMISGYNLTKLGDVNEDSKAIRAYSQSSFNLSSENKSKVCNFSGFSGCLDINNQLIV